MSKLNSLTIFEARDGLLNKDFTSEEIVMDCLSSISVSKKLNSFISVNADHAIKQAKESDIRIRKQEGRFLEGIPLGIKDLFCTQGLKTTAGSHILESFVPNYESTVTSNLLSDGAIVIGKTNLDEFAMGSSNETSFFGSAVNPWRSKSDKNFLVPGGSSGGSAAAVSARLCLAATGTDTGGSIRQPASFNGIVGLKPTYGRCSRWGIVAFASSLDQAGPMTRTVRDAAILLRSMASFDSKDSTSVNHPVPNYEKALDLGLKGLRVGIPKEYRLPNLDIETEKFWQKGIDWALESGAEIVEISLPHTNFALPAYYILAPAEASSNLARYDGVRYGLRVDGENLDEMYENTRAEGFGEEVKRRILIGTYVLSAGYYDAYYIKAQKIRTLISNDFKKAFEKVDILLTPTTPTTAFAQQEKINDPVSMYQNDLLTVPANMAGVPAISIPAGLTSEGLPTGLQLIGRPFDEETIFRVSSVLERCADFLHVPEKWWEE